MKEHNTPETLLEDDHLQENILHAYLDGELTAMEIKTVENHLETCNRCQVRLQELQSTFTALDELPDLALDVDLATPVLRSLKAERDVIPALPWITAAQAAAAVVLLALTLPILLTLPLFQSMKISLINWGSVLQVNILNMTAGLQAQIQGLQTFFEQMLNAYSRFSVPDFHFIPLWILFLAAALLGILGNTLLLRRELNL
ncbi:MAG: zf-HC2 domain-containing protein [Anaerolineales bacterium]|nr:zf-HC2 domain-containing protein [Anaerolineales bacterium]MBS3752425.1 zf-HC2 domain-containing protein [Anaerolineales bacterium]